MPEWERFIKKMTPIIFSNRDLDGSNVTKNTTIRFAAIETPTGKTNIIPVISAVRRFSENYPNNEKRDQT